MEAYLEWSLWLSALMVLFVTVGYPVVIVAAGLLVRRRRIVDASEPTVTLIIAAHNEERCIKAKLENTLALDYPRDRIEIIVASDGSTDRTHDIVRSFAGDGVQLRPFARIGKTGMQNVVAKSVKSEVLVFSDANAMYRSDAIRKLVRNFADPQVACASGQLVYQIGTRSAGMGENSYWNYEKLLKRCESDRSSIIGANGSIYAVRRIDYVEIDNDLISDLVEPLALVRRGKRVVYEPEAVSIEEAAGTYDVEFRRKVRILTRSIKGLLHMRVLLNPFRYGFFSLQLIIHKLLRYLVPAFLVIGLTSLAGLAASGRYRALFVLASLGLSAAIFVGRNLQPSRNNPVIRACHLLYYYLVVNYALIPAWINVVRGTGVTVWVPERKEAA